MATAGGLQRSEARAGAFRLVRWTRFAPGTPVLRLYIEGDGHAWARPDRPSDDPTPWQPVALELAARDPAASVAWLSRPCQYLDPGPAADSACDQRFWTDERYAEVVVQSASIAVDQLLAASGARSVELVGFSGGGAVAALVAARRHDVVTLRTVAANLDTAAWTRSHGLRPLRGSLNPADAAGRLASVAQVHFVGAGDANVGPAIAAAYRARFPPPNCLSVILVADVTHTEGWAERWEGLLRSPAVCLP